SQLYFSTNWNSAELASKRQTITSEMANVTEVAHSAIQRAVPRASRSLPRTSSATRTAPSSGRKVTTDSIGQFILISCAGSFPKTGSCLVCPHREHEPGDESRRPDQHGKGVVIKVTGLQSHHVARDVEHPRRHAVRPEAVDQPAITTLPQQTAKPN